MIRPIIVCTLMLLGLAGCFRGGSGAVESPPSVNLSDLLPDEWEFTGHYEINIDENPMWIERLIFFKFGKSADSDGITPIGATIYDSQYDGRLQTGTDELMPNQASAILVPYRLLPSYWQGAGQGFIAQSNEEITTDDLDAVIRLHDDEIGRAGQQPDSSAEPSTGEATPVPTPTPSIMPADELIIWGGSPSTKTRMTVVWWKSIHEGYGFTQVYAPGGLYNIQRDTGDGVDKKPVRWLRGSWPRNDRSMFCYDVRYTRVPDPKNDGDDPWQRAVQYVATPLGLTFCHGVPIHPFYPEAVVLAYLLDPENSAHLVFGDQESSFPEFLGTPNAYYIDNISARPTIDLTEPVETYVCVELMKSDGTPLSDQLAPYQDEEHPVFSQTKRQLLSFWLRYDKPEFESYRSSDRLKIMRINRIDSPSSDHVTNDCDRYMQQN